MASVHDGALAGLGLAAPERTALAAYLDRLAAWGRRANLTGARTPEERVARLVAPALPAVGLVEGPSLLDVGSGNGSPGLVLALLRPDLEVTLLEPRARRWAFLREAAREVGRLDLTVLRERHDTHAGPPAQTVTIRALDLPLAALRPLLRPGGVVLRFGPRPGPAPGFREESVPAAGLHRWRAVPVSRGTGAAGST